MSLGELEGWSPDTIKMIDRFEKWCDPEKLKAILDKKQPDESRKFLLNNELEQWWGQSGKPWEKAYPTQKQMNAFTDKYNVEEYYVDELQKKYDTKFEFQTDEYYYRSDKKAYADIGKDKIYENVIESEVNFTYGKRIVLRDSKGRFIKHKKDLETGKWLM